MVTIAASQTFEERTQLCLGCHGEKGQSETPCIMSFIGSAVRSFSRNM